MNDRGGIMRRATHSLQPVKLPLGKLILARMFQNSFLKLGIHGLKLVEGRFLRHDEQFLIK